MHVGVIGLGIVGGAVHEGLINLGHDVRGHDIKLGTEIQSVLDTEICFVCVPTPSNDDGSCNTIIVEEVVSDLNEFKYKGVVALKSTITPGTTTRLSEKFPDLTICFVPEFLRERCAVSDFIENHDLCVIGTTSSNVFEAVKECHGSYPEEFLQLAPTEAELIKYFNNVHNALLVTFANCFYQVCEELGANYTNVKSAAVKRPHIHDSYLDCNEEMRGFGGPCLPKDTRALASLVREHNMDIELFNIMLKENNKYKTTVWPGMRE